MFGQMPIENHGQQEPASRNLFCVCFSKVLCFLSFLFAAALGLILGAFFSVPLLAAIAAVIVGAVILAILIISLLIYIKCIGCRYGC